VRALWFCLCSIEAVHGHALLPEKKDSPGGASGSSGSSSSAASTEGGDGGGASSSASASASSVLASEDGLLGGVDSPDRLETDSGISIYPHDADSVLLELDPSIHVETVYLRPDVRQSIAAIRRRKHTTDVFINLYDRADETGQKIVDFMAREGLAFTGAGSRFYDPTRMELKRLCRYNGIPTPAFAIVADAKRCAELPDALGGFVRFSAVLPLACFAGLLLCLLASRTAESRND
jgi:hypothetical protein